jgi:gas vesicle protein
MHSIFKYFIFILPIIFSSCTTMKDSITVGALSGAATGAASANIFSDTDKRENTLVGAATGAVIGGIASYILHGSLEKRDKDVRKKTLFNLENFGVKKEDKFWEGHNYIRERRERDLAR